MMLAPAAHGGSSCTPVAVYGAGFESNFAGEGTELEPYLIETAEDLRHLADWVNAGNNAAGLFFKMTRDIDISSEYWTPIGINQDNVFSGNFNGGGHKITGLNIPVSMDVQYAGLFGVVSNAIFKNLTVEIGNVGVRASHYETAYAGGIAARGVTVEIINCHVIGAISVTGCEFASRDFAGGIIGYGNTLSLSYSSFVGEIQANAWMANLGGLVGATWRGNIMNSYAYSTVLSLEENDAITSRFYTQSIVMRHANTGGLVGFNDGIISHSYAVSTVSSAYTVGGLVGYNSGRDSNISYSFAISTVSGNSNVGGLVGINREGNISHSYAHSTIALPVSNTRLGATGIGGLVGSNRGRYSSISYSYAISTISGNRDINININISNVGGLVGRNEGSISNSHAISTVYGTRNIGGLVGDNSGLTVGLSHGIISHSYAIATVSGNDNVGGLVGITSWGSNISYSYAVSTVSGNDNVGGLIGENSGGIVSNSYAISAVSGNNNVGGLVGRSGLVGSSARGSYISSYAVATVSGNNNVGGLLGFSGGNCVVLSSYYDSDVSDLHDTNRGTPLTTLQMQDKASLAGFDFDTVWAIDPSINDGYPHLQSLVPETLGGAIQVSIPNADTYRNYIVRFSALEFERNIHVTGQLVSLSGLDRTKIYKVELRSPIGVVFGTIENINLSENRVANVAFDSLPLPRSVRMSLFGESGAVHSGFTVNWYEGTRLLGEGSRLDGLRAGMQVRYEITLGSPLDSIYAKPEGNSITISENDNANFVTINLVSLQSQLTTVTGSVQSGGSAVAGAMVILRSRPGVEPPFEIVVFTDANGRFEADVLPGNFIVEVVRFGFINRRWNLRWDDDVVGGTIPNIELEQAEGLIVQLAMEYTEASVPGEFPNVWPLSNTRNINFTVRNVTQNRNLADVRLSGMALVLPDSTINESDEIRITAVDTTGNMLNAEVSFIARDHAAGVTLSFVQKGFWQAREFISTSSVMALVYDEAGRYIATYNPAGRNITGSVLPAGQYTVVFIGRSQLLRHLANLSDLAALGLIEGRDYVRRNVTITDGVISVINNMSIPALDETRLHFTDPTRTSLTANRADVTAGALVTMRAEFAFPPRYTGRIANSTIVIRMPSDSELIPNSVTVDGRASDYRRTPTGFEVRVPNTSGVVRFLAVPRTIGNHAFNAFIRFEYQGSTLLQPVGTVVVQAEHLRINVPARTGIKTVTTWGIAEPGRQVTIFANDNEVGTTMSNAVGSWQLTFDLVDTSTFSVHNIHAEVAMDLGTVVRSETVRTTYNITLRPQQLSRITMLNSWAQGLHGDEISGSTDFDFLSPAKRTPPFYVWHPLHPYFTFIVELVDDLPEAVANTLNVYAVTRNSDRSYTRIRTFYDRTRRAWIGTHRFDNSRKLPVAVGAEIVNTESFILDAEMLNAIHEIIDMPDPKDIDLDDFDIDFELDPEFEQKLADFLERTQNMTQEEFEAEVIAGLDNLERQIGDLFTEWEAIVPGSGVDTTTGDASGYNKSTMITDGFIALLASDGNYIYTKTTDSSFIMVDFKRNHSQIITFSEPLDDPFNRLHSMRSTGGAISLERLTLYMQNYKLSLLDTIESVEVLLDAGIELLERNLNYWIRVLSESRRTGFSIFIRGRIAAINAQLEVLRNVTRSLNAIGTSVSLIFDIGMVIQESGRFEWARRLIAVCCPTGCTGCTGDELEIMRNMEHEEFFGYIFRTRSASYSIIKLATWGAKLTKGWSLVAIPAKTIYINYADSLRKSRTTDIMTEIKDAVRICRERCAQEPDPEPEPEPNPRPGPTRPVRVIIDPSGYVYEAVPSNRLPGVTVTVYEKAGGFFNAEEFDQHNPLITDWEGRYAWDVPMGYWQVRAVKDGFEPTQSDWLPVPPPQFDVNIGMISRAAPYVVYASGFENFIEIAFSRFMIPDTLTTDSITLTGSVPPDGYEIAWVDAEEDYNIEPVRMFVRTIRILPNNGTFPMGETVGVLISTAAQSYADVALANAFHSYVEIKMEPRQLENQGQINLRHGETQTISVTVLPVGSGANRRIRASSSSPIFVTIDEEAMTDTNGTATFRVSGELSGVANISFTLDGTQVRSASRVTVALPGEPAQTTTRYRAVALTSNAGGVARADRILAARGDTVTITLTPHSGNELANISATDESSAAVKLYGSENTRTFTMPASAVSINVLFRDASVSSDGMTIYPASASITVGSTLQLTATIISPDAANQDVTWNSTTPGVATVNNTGLVTAIAEGASVITATTADGIYAATSIITVTGDNLVNVPVSNIMITPQSLNLREGSQGSLSVVFSPINATNQAVTWNTSNDSVAAVNNGVVTARRTGSAVITAISVDGNIRSSSNVTVMRLLCCDNDDRQAYFESRFPGRNVVILPDYGVLYAADGNTVIVGGAGDDWIEMSGGGNIFIYEIGGGHDVVRSINAEKSSNELQFGPGITRDDLSFFKNGNDLRISIASENGEETGSVTIVNWYVAEQYRLRVFLHDGTELSLTYMISASALASFGSLQMTYVQPEAQTVTITNTGLASITLTQPTAMNFDIGELSTTTLAASGDITTFTIRPKANLSIGVYDETITISGCNEASVTVNVSFEVTRLSDRDTISGSSGGSGGCNVAVGYAFAMWLMLLMFVLKIKR